MVDLVIIGGGPAGMSAAVAAYEKGVRDILILEREESLGGILKQCIHNGFGLHKFGEELTGPEYAERYEEKVKALGIPYKLNTTVTDITPEKVITAQNGEDGIFQIEAGAIILSMGCRERPRGALNIPGSRPAGIYSAGAAQRLINLAGFMPGKNVVILGSGDIGLIMARRMTLEGAKVKAVCEVMPYSGGLARNITQCLDDFGIPLKCSHTVVNIHGKERLEGVTIARVDEKRMPVEGTEEFIPCDTLLLSVGLIPENELSKCASVLLDPVTGGAVVNEDRETSCPGIFACGNVLHVHDLVDFVSEEGEIAAMGAAAYIMGKEKGREAVAIRPGALVRYTVPQKITEKKDVKVYFRVSDVRRNGEILVKSGEKVLLKKKKAKLAPGEMESVALKKEFLENAKEIEICVEEKGCE